jgi:hypothetical protein
MLIAHGLAGWEGLVDIGKDIRLSAESGMNAGKLSTLAIRGSVWLSESA